MQEPAIQLEVVGLSPLTHSPDTSWVYLFIFLNKRPNSKVEKGRHHFCLNVLSRHAEVMKKIIETVAEGGGELGVHMYPLVLETVRNFTFTLLHFGDYDTCGLILHEPGARHTSERLVSTCVCVAVLFSTPPPQH